MINFIKQDYLEEDERQSIEGEVGERRAGQTKERSGE